MLWVDYTFFMKKGIKLETIVIQDFLSGTQKVFIEHMTNFQDKQWQSYATNVENLTCSKGRKHILINNPWTFYS